MNNLRPSRSAGPYLWSFTTYFTEGFPYTLFRTISSVFFRDRGMSLESIGLTSLFGLPWVIKFLWSPQVDEFGTKRQWLLITQGLLVILILATAFVMPLTWALPVVVTLFFAGCFIAATHDIAIDGYYMEALDNAGQAQFIGYRVMAYRIAMMTGTGVIVSIGTTLGWFPAFFAAGLLLGGFFLFHFLFLPRCETERRPLGQLVPTLLKPKHLFYLAGGGLAVVGLRTLLQSAAYARIEAVAPFFSYLTFPAWIGIILFMGLLGLVWFRKKIHAWIMTRPDSFYTGAFISFIDREKPGAILAFIILIRTGEFMLTSMLSPFLVDLGLKVHYGWISGGIGLPSSIAGAMLGGWLIARHGLKKMIWPFLVAQNCTNLVYMALALSLEGYLAVNTGNSTPQPIGAANLLTVVAVHGFDQFAGGLGTAVLMTYLMRICRKEFKAAHYAIGSGLMSASGLYAGILSGFLAAWLGYGYFFGLSFLLSLPGMVMVFFIPRLDHHPHLPTP